MFKKIIDTAGNVLYINPNNITFVFKMHDNKWKIEFLNKQAIYVKDDDNVNSLLNITTPTMLND